MEVALRALLTGSAAVTALAPPSRIEWGALGQGKALPAIVLNTISGMDNSVHHQGAGGLWRSRVQVDCYGATYAATLGLANAVIGALHGHCGGQLELILLDSRRDHHETGAADRPYRIGLDFIVNYRRA